MLKIYTIAVLFTFCVGCLSTPAGEQSDASNDAGGDVATRGDMGDSADTDGDEDTSPDPECRDEDCEGAPGAVAACVDGTCTRMCADDFVDLDGDLANADSNGCECEIKSDTDDTCDSVDDDCDGEVDEDAPAQPCSLSDGVCADVMIACTDGAYAECDEQYLADNVPEWTAEDDENFTCDEMDNDCDGEADEACCAAGTEPPRFLVGDGLWPTIAPAVDAAPDGAEFVVGYLQDLEILHLVHIDADGNPVGTPYMVDLPYDGARQPDIGSSEDEYYVAVRSTNFDDSVERVHVGRLRADLTLIDDWPAAGSADDLDRSSIAVGDTHVCVMWEEGRSDESVELSCYPHGPPPQTASPGTIHAASDGSGSVESDVAMVGDRVAVAYGTDSRVNTVTFAQNGTDSIAGPTTDVDSPEEVQIEAGGDTAFVAWHTNNVLEGRDFASDGTPGADTAVLATETDEFAMTAVGESVIIAFGDPATGYMSVGTVEVTAPSTITDSRDVVSGLGSDQFGTLRIAQNDRMLGLVMVNDGARFVPISREGIPLCY